MATSTEGRAIPLVVIGKPAPEDPLAVRYDKRIVLYFQANIHAGEVEGKEATLMLARDIVLDPKLPYLDKIVLLIAPIFNADGNDKMDPANRRGQVGPEKGSGLRQNGQNLDLNRDAMKLESPEMRGLVRNVLGRWDPLLLVDCHTTDGSFHQEPVTYSWPLCPNGDPAVLKYARDKMLPAVDAALEKKYGTLSVPYGDPMDFKDMEKGWQTFGHQPRYMTNYVGLRDRLSVLIENYNYADFRTRVAGNYHMLQALLDYCWANAAELQRLVADADARTVQSGLAPGETDTFGLDIDVQPLPGKVTILGYEMEAPTAPAEGGGGPFPRMRPTDRKKTYIMPYYADFVAKRTVRLPYAYLIPLAATDVPDKLRQHGLAVERLTAPATLETEAFRLKEIKGAERLYQGHRTNSVKGEYAVEKREFPAGDLSRPDGPAPGPAGRLPPRAGERRRPSRLEFFRPGHRQPVGPRGTDLPGLQALYPAESGCRDRRIAAEKLLLFLLGRYEVLAAVLADVDVVGVFHGRIHLRRDVDVAALADPVDGVGDGETVALHQPVEAGQDIAVELFPDHGRVLLELLLLLFGGFLLPQLDLLELLEHPGPADDLLLVDELEFDPGEDVVELRLVLGRLDPAAVLGPDEEAGQAGEEVVEEAGQGRVPDDEDDQVDFLAVVGVEVDALLRPADGDGDLAFGVDAGVRQGDAAADGRGDEVLAVDDAGQGQLLVVDELLFGQQVQELFDGLDLILALEVKNDLVGFEVIGKAGDMRGGLYSPLLKSLAHPA